LNINSFKYIATIATLIFLFLGVSAQNLSNLRNQKFSFVTDTFKIDTIGIIPNSEDLRTINNETINKADYKINYNQSYIVRLNKNLTDSLILSYRILPLFLSKTYSIRDSAY